MTKQEKREKIAGLIDEINDIKLKKVIYAEEGEKVQLPEGMLKNVSLRRLETEILERKTVLAGTKIQIDELEKQIESLL